MTNFDRGIYTEAMFDTEKTKLQEYQLRKMAEGGYIGMQDKVVLQCRIHEFELLLCDTTMTVDY